MSEPCPNRVQLCPSPVQAESLGRPWTVPGPSRSVPDSSELCPNRVRALSEPRPSLVQTPSEACTAAYSFVQLHTQGLPTPLQTASVAEVVYRNRVHAPSSPILNHQTSPPPVQYHKPSCGRAPPFVQPLRANFSTPTQHHPQPANTTHTSTNTTPQRPPTPSALLHAHKQRPPQRHHPHAPRYSTPIQRAA